MQIYSQSAIWNRTLAQQESDDKYRDARSRLARSFVSTRQAVVPLVRKIEQELPMLTVHDETHLDALWHVADILIGTELEINPAEAYVLGMAFLLHDTATSSFAYPDGIESIRKSVEWKDYVTQQKFTEDQLRPGERQYQIALFETLRSLHAIQAAKLLSHSWKDSNGVDRYLLEDVVLRNHYGQTIGEIAASHGEDASKVEEKWGHAAPLAAHSSLGLDAAANWGVDRLKLAMLLRCIDASHIDSLRAPDFSMMLNAPTGESEKHWTFQNKLSSLAVNEKGEVYWSGSAFSVLQSNAWWRCYETCQMIDREIRTSNRILSDNGRTPLAVSCVMGANDIELFQKNVPVEGWHPLNFNFQVSQVGNVIEKFGGKALYGDDPAMALRELIQNSADAIRARRIQVGNMLHGKITISLRQALDGSEWLDVVDDGLGMSKYVLTDVLLDFGRSLWNDTSLREQWRGLASKGFEPVGKFGIGFFSVFMLGDEVKVTTWRYGSAISDQITLHLRNRVIERPILLQTVEEERLSESGTKISIRLRDGRKSFLQDKSNYVPRLGRLKKEREFSLADLVAYLAPTLDIDVWCRDGDVMAMKIIQANDWETLDSNLLLRRLNSNMSDDALVRYAPKLLPMHDVDGRLVGRAALLLDRYTWYRSGGSGVLVHRGLRSGECLGIVGFIFAENSKDLARQITVPIVTESTLRQWTKVQVSLASHYGQALTEKIVSLDCGDKNSVIGSIAGQSVTILDLIDKLRDAQEVVCFVKEVECPSNMSESDFEDFEVSESVLDLSRNGCSTRFDFGMREWIERIMPGDQGNPKVIFELIMHHLRAEFDDLVVVSENRVIGEANYEQFEQECIIFRR
ncbi:HD domain-containing protein [Janthinobacterium lividum]